MDLPKSLELLRDEAVSLLYQSSQKISFYYFLLAEARTPSEARGEEKTNRLMWNLLEKVRTYYQENPDADF